MKTKTQTRSCAWPVPFEPAPPVNAGQTLQGSPPAVPFSATASASAPASTSAASSVPALPQDSPASIPRKQLTSADRWKLRQAVKVLLRDPAYRPSHIFLHGEYTNSIFKGAAGGYELLVVCEQFLPGPSPGENIRKIKTLLRKGGEEGVPVTVVYCTVKMFLDLKRNAYFFNMVPKCGLLLYDSGVCPAVTRPAPFRSARALASLEKELPGELERARIFLADATSKCAESQYRVAAAYLYQGFRQVFFALQFLHYGAVVNEAFPVAMIDVCRQSSDGFNAIFGNEVKIKALTENLSRFGCACSCGNRFFFSDILLGKYSLLLEETINAAAREYYARLKFLAHVKALG